MKTDVVIIGAGPGGYVAAIRLGQLGKEVTIIDKAQVGGTCLQMGCIPSKALIGVGHLMESFHEAATMGFEIKGEIKLDFGKTQEWKNKILSQLTRGIQGLLKANKVNLVQGEASFKSPKELIVKGPDGEKTIEFNTCMIATGSIPIEIPGFKFDGKKVISSTEALNLPEIPKRMAVIGGGYIGLEMGMMYAQLGTAVTVVEMTPHLLPGFDTDCVAVIEKKMKKLKMDVLVETKAASYQEKGKSLVMKLDRKGESIDLETDVILVTVGRRPFSGGLKLENAGLKVNAQGYLDVNESLQTALAHIYCIGDLAKQSNPQPMLAHRASKEGEVAAEHIAGHGNVYDVRAIPAVVFTTPELASVGLNETEAKAKGYNVIVGKFPFMAIAKSLIGNHPEGFVKIIAERDSKLMLGMQIVGHDAGNLISEGVPLLEMGATVTDLALMVHAHPTLPEAIMEAAKAALGEAIHIPNR